jgi:hypothetical protein
VHDALAEGDDFFHVVLSDGKTDQVIDVNANGILTDGTRPAGTKGPLFLGWESGAHVSIEHDGTPNDTRDIDEEWIIEMAIPFESIGLRGDKGETIGLSIRRCDTLRNGMTRCGSWGEGAIFAPGEAPPEAGKKGVLVLD